MAGETDQFSKRAEDGWKNFSRLMAATAVGAAVTLVLMALFLL